MLKLIEGGLCSAAREEMKNKIEDLVKNKNKVFLIVPEQKTVTSEKEMSLSLPPYSPRYFEVTNFTRLANLVFRSIGGIAGEYSDKAKDALVMWRTLTELSPHLSALGMRKEINTGLVMRALSAVKEMKNISRGPRDIENAANDPNIAKDKLLSTKLSDLSKIMTLYKTLHDERYSDIGDDIETLSEVLEKNPSFFEGTVFFTEGFTSFTEPQYRLLGTLMKISEVNVLLPISKAMRDSFEYSEIRDTEEKLLKTADRYGIKKFITKPDSRDMSKNCIISNICDMLWHNFGTLNECGDEIKETVRIYEAADPYEEADFICSDIKRRVMAGEHYRDFAVVMRDAGMYEGIIDSAFASGGIPHFMSKSKQVFTFESIKLIYTAFAVIESNFERKNVISYMKCGLCGISAEACDEFELYTEKWNINKQRFTDGIIWNMSPLGYSSSSESQRDKLLEIDKARHTVIDPLLKFRDNLSSAKTAKDYARVLTYFLVDIELEAQIEERAKELSALGEDRFAEDHLSIWKIITGSLDTIADALGDTETDIQSFISQLKIVHSFANIGKIPSFCDEVTVGSADMLRISDKKHIYLVGVNSGEFPRSVREYSFFTERDKHLLSEAGISYSGSGDIAYARELFAFSRAFSSTKEDVTLLYSLRDSSFKNTKMSDVIRRICEICNGQVVIQKISSLSLSERIYSPDTALNFIGEPHKKNNITNALRSVGYSYELDVADKPIKNSSLKLTRSITDKAYPSELALTQTRIDTYLSCPLSYYLRYNLRLSENEKAEFDARNIGTFIHAILENFFTNVRDEGIKIANITEKKKKELVESSARRFLESVMTDGTIKTKREKIMLDRLSRSAMPVVNGLCEELANSKYVPSFFELKIGNDDPKIPSPAKFKSSDGKDVFIYGSIDRVDTYKAENGDVYVRVIDYKTGHKNFKPDDIEEGKNLQMFLYLRSVVESENKEFRDEIGASGEEQLIPAGVIYVKTDMSDALIPHADGEAAESAIQKKQERRGMILNDEESISAMNTAYIPVKFKKDGTPDARSEKLLYSLADWEKINQKISDKICEISTQMKNGDISTAKKSDTSPCSYCKYKPICRSAKE